MGDDPGLSFRNHSSSSETSREHGHSYMTITEWVGLVGVWPFVGLLVVTLSNIWRVCAWMHRTANPRHSLFRWPWCCCLVLFTPALKTGSSPLVHICVSIFGFAPFSSPNVPGRSASVACSCSPAFASGTRRFWSRCY